MSDSKFSKTVIILSGVSGSGKSTYAEHLKSLDKEGTVICCADDYHMVDGKYQFDYKKLKAAHEQCFDKFVKALDSPFIGNVIVANTNTSEKEYEKYKEHAEFFGATCFRIIVDNIHNNKNIHNVPKGVLETQFTRLKHSLHKS